MTLNIYRHDGSLKGTQEIEGKPPQLVEQAQEASSEGYQVIGGENLDGAVTERVLNIVALDGMVMIQNISE